MSKHLEHGMHLVYLDQCVLSRFLESPGNDEWHEFRETILKGNERRRILCPTSLEHLIETSLLSDDRAIFLDELMQKLSFGWALLDEALLITEQIIAKLRKHRVSRTSFLAKRFLNPITSPGILAGLREIKVGLDQNNAWLMQGVNELNALIRDGQKGDKEMLDVMIRLRIDGRVRKLFDEVVDSLKTGKVIIRAEKENDKVMNWASKVVYELIVKHRLTPAEARQICQLLNMKRLDFIPTLKIKAELEAFQFFGKEKIEPRDQYDITRAACALPYADIFITDGGKASAIRELKLNTAYKTEVFSTKKSELSGLTRRLSEIVN